MRLRGLNLSVSVAVKHAPQAASVAFAILLFFLGWNSLKIIRATPHTNLPARNAQIRAVERPNSAEPIADIHLFGMAPSVNAVPGIPPSSSWHVVGIIAGTTPQDSMADIAIDGVEHIWHVGDQLPDGSTLTAVDADGIKTSRDSSPLPFELQTISYNAHFDTLPVNNEGDPTAPRSAIPMAHPQKAQPLSAQMTALRAGGIAVWQERIADMPRPAAPKTPPTGSPNH